MTNAEAEADVVQFLGRMSVFEGIFERHWEIEALERLIERGDVERYYEGPAALLGMAKVRLARR